MAILSDNGSNDAKSLGVIASVPVTPRAVGLWMPSRSPSVEICAIPAHWEGDMMSSSYVSHNATLVERRSRCVHIVRVTGKNISAVVTALIRDFQRTNACAGRSERLSSICASSHGNGSWGNSTAFGRFRSDQRALVNKNHARLAARRTEPSTVKCDR